MQKKNDSWVFPKELENDEDLMRGMNIISNNTEGRDFRERWKNIKVDFQSVIKEIMKRRNEEENLMKKIFE